MHPQLLLRILRNGQQPASAPSTATAAPTHPVQEETTTDAPSTTDMSQLPSADGMETANGSGVDVEGLIEAARARFDHCDISNATTTVQRIPTCTKAELRTGLHEFILSVQSRLGNFALVIEAVDSKTQEIVSVLEQGLGKSTNCNNTYWCIISRVDGNWRLSTATKAFGLTEQLWETALLGHCPTECPICIEELDLEHCSYLDCLHPICKKCLLQLRQRGSNTCPVCRQSIVSTVAVDPLLEC